MWYPAGNQISHFVELNLERSVQKNQLRTLFITDIAVLLEMFVLKLPSKSRYLRKYRSDEKTRKNT